MKEKKRYILFEIKSLQQYSTQEINDAIEDALKTFLGDLGLAKAAPSFIKEKSKNNHFVIKVSNSYVDECKSAIILIKTIKKKPVIIASKATSGTLKKISS